MSRNVVNKRLVADFPAGLLIALAIMAVLAVTAVVLAVFGVRNGRRRYASNVNAAGQYGFQATRIPPPWTRFLPEDGRGLLTSLFEGRHGGRPVVLGQYLYTHYYRVLGPISSHHRRFRLSVVAIRLREPHAPRFGDGPYYHWQCVGPDLLAWCEGALEIPGILRLVDDLAPIAEWLEANP